MKIGSEERRDGTAASSDTSQLQTAPGRESSGTPKRLCPHCATLSQTSGEFCPHCGGSFLRQSRKHSRRTTIILVGVLVLLVLAAGSAFAVMRGPTAAQKRVAAAKAAAQSNFEAGYACSSNDRAKMNSAEASAGYCIVIKLGAEVKIAAASGTNSDVVMKPYEAGAFAAMADAPNFRPDRTYNPHHNYVRHPASDN